MQKIRGFALPDWLTVIVLFVVGIITFGLLSQEPGSFWDVWPKALVNILFGFKGSNSGISLLFNCPTFECAVALASLFNLVLPIFVLKAAAKFFQQRWLQAVFHFLSMGPIIHSTKNCRILYTAWHKFLPLEKILIV